VVFPHSKEFRSELVNIHAGRPGCVVRRKRVKCYGFVTGA